MNRRRILFVVAALALLVVSLNGAKPLADTPTRVDHGVTLSTAHTATGLTVMRHKSAGSHRSLLRILAALHSSLQQATVLAAVALVLTTAVVVRRYPRSAIALRAPPSFPI